MKLIALKCQVIGLFVIVIRMWIILKACLHLPSPSPCPLMSPSNFQISIVCMMTVRMGLEPILSVKRSVSIDTMIKFDGDIDGHGDGMCKQALISSIKS